jgi:hypothetical protein
LTFRLDTVLVLLRTGCDPATREERAERERVRAEAASVSSPACARRSLACGGSIVKGNGSCSATASQLEAAT